MMRLDKFLCETGFGPRSQAKALIKKGFVSVNGEGTKKAEQKIDEKSDRIVCKGQEIVYQKYHYLMLNKPAGVLSATEDSSQKTVLDLVTEKCSSHLFPVGRLDKDTEGLLLLTNDGELAHRLLAPKSHVDKKYYAKVSGTISEEQVRQFAAGLDIGEKSCTLPARLEIIKCGGESEVYVTIQEGKFHQIKRMFEAVGCHVFYLKRLSMGTLVLDQNLKAGEYRKLTEKEQEDLKELCEIR